jgi:rubrerythrin
MAKNSEKEPELVVFICNLCNTVAPEQNKHPGHCETCGCPEFRMVKVAKTF